MQKSAIIFYVVWILLPVCQGFAGEVQEALPRISTNVGRDSLFAMGEQVFRAGDSDRAIQIFSYLVDIHPEDAHLWTRLGHALLRKEDFNAAQKAFEKARDLDEMLLDAYVGLGLVAAERPAKGIAAFQNFRIAYRHARRAVFLDSTYAPAYRLLGEIFERFREDHERAIGYFVRYLDLEPGDPDGLYFFGLACVQAMQFDKIDRYITPYLEMNPTEIRLLPLSAQAAFFLERYDQALEYFERYLQHLGERERLLYTDISRIASEKELEVFSALSEDSERQAFLEHFWAIRDSDLLTKINERAIEHYRRVWYARTFFSDQIYPWDKRGDVYIRYGEPDYRSRSVKRQFVQNPKVDAVRTRLAIGLYGPDAALLTFTGPIFPVRAHRHPMTRREIDLNWASPVENPLQEGVVVPDPEDQERGLDEAAPRAPLDRREIDEWDGARFDEFGNRNVRLNFDGYAPVTIHNDVAVVPWEVWTYTEVQKGIEFVFTDENNKGQFDFAPIPPVVGRETQMDVASRLIQHAPNIIYQNTVSAIPDFYRPSFLKPPLDFYFDLASFRGQDGRTSLEVYYGIPPSEIQPLLHADSTYIHVMCALALADEDRREIFRTGEEFFYFDAVEMVTARGTFLPEQLRLKIPPGKYELQVQLKDRISGRTGIYRQALKVEDYQPERLLISDIQLASAIRDSGIAGRFQKGDVWIVPMPTRTYAEAQKIYAYYEIYNLERDAFGQTRYKVHYAVRSSASPDVGVMDVITAGIRAMLKSGRPQVSITYEQTGSTPDGREYFEIDLSKTKPGLKVLEVTVHDLVSGETASREIVFHYGK